MFEFLPVPISVYCFSLVLGVAAPLLIYFMLRPALKHFLASIFADPKIEVFWLQVILLVLLLAALSAAVRYRPDRAASGVTGSSSSPDMMTPSFFRSVL